MANYSLVINSKFKPFSLERYLQPLQLYGQAYREQEDAYADLATKAATVESMANEQTDPESYKAYQNYADALRTQADILATEGLTPSSRQTMLNMRKRYTQEVVPIQDAYNRRREQAKMQADILKADPTRLFSRMAATTSLDDYRNNKNLDLTLENYSGALLTKQVSDEAAALAKAARNDPNVQTQLRRLLPYQYETIRRTGFDPETVRQAILRSPEANPILTGIVDRVMEGSGIANWTYTSPEEKQRIWNQAVSTASQGLWSAVGQTQYGSVSDTYGANAAIESLRHKHTMDEIREKNKGTINANGLPYRRIANSRVLEANTSKLNNDLKFLENLGQNGVDRLSREAPPRTNYEVSIGAPRRSSDYDTTIRNFKRIAKEYGLGNVSEWNADNNAALIEKIKDKISQNVQRSQIYQINMTDQSQVAKILQENSNTFSIRDRNRSGLTEIDDKGRKTDYLDADDAAEIFEDGKDFNVSYDPETGFQLSYRLNGKFGTVSIDPELLNFGDEDYTQGHMTVQQYINSGQYDYANDLIDEMMTGLYYRFNTQAKKETATDKDIE